MFFDWNIFSEILPDGRTITYSLEVEEEILEEEEEIEINSSRTVGTKTADTGQTLTSILEGEEITVNKSLSRTVSREDGEVTRREIVQSQEREGGASFSLEWSGRDSEREEKLESENQRTSEETNTFLSEQGVLITELWPAAVSQLSHLTQTTQSQIKENKLISNDSLEILWAKFISFLMLVYPRNVQMSRSLMIRRSD